MKKIILLAILSAAGNGIYAQGVRQINQTTVQTQQTNVPKVAVAPNTFAAEYTGGLFGFSKKVKGTLTYDDANQRFVFRNKENKEVFGFPYKAILVVEPTSKSVRSTGATVASNIPLPGAGLFGLIRSKNRFLTIQFDDPDSKVQGTTSFKVANNELLQSAVQALGEKAEMKQRGAAYYRAREESKSVL